VTAEQTEPIPLPMVCAQPVERRDAAVNRARILAAAHRVLAERGPDGFTMDAVACAAGVGKGTIFRRFGDRAGLAEELVNDHMREFQDRFLHGPPPLGPGAPPQARLEAFVVEWLRLQIDHLAASRVVERTPEHRSSRAFAALLIHVATLVREIDPDLNDLVVADMVLGAFGPSLIDHLSRRRAVDADALESSALAVLRGITPPSR
jgi:AcrR family transcriptional regulator